VFVGIDVAERRLEGHARPSGERFALDHHDEGMATLVGRPAALGPAPVVLEGTGGPEVRLAAAPAAAGPPVAIVDPRRVRAFARATGRPAETARPNAEAIARFAEAVRPPARPLADEASRRLGALVACRRQPLEVLTAERSRRRAAGPALHERISAHLRRLAEVQAEIGRVGLPPAGEVRSPLVRPSSRFRAG
jgi:transposase